MEPALAASSGFVKYVYTGKATILLDDHHDTHEVDFLTGDEFSVKLNGSEATLIHHDAPRIKFKAQVTDKKYIKLMRGSTATEFAFVPTPKFPAYPFIPNLTFEMIPQLYDYLNETQFNNMCPPSSALLFQKTTSGTALGVASYKKVGGRHVYKMLVNMKRIGQDMILTIDVLLHEMIHLRLYRQGVDHDDRNALHAGHGPLFTAEMDRLNKKGFNISQILDWENRAESDLETYIIRVLSPSNPTHAKYFWSLDNLEPLFDDIVRQLQAHDPTRLYTIDLVASKSAEMRGGNQLSKNGKIPIAKLKLWYEAVPIKGRVLKTLKLTPQDVISNRDTLKVPKSEETYYAQPLNIFSSWCRKTKINASDGYIQTMWSRFPAEKILPFARAELIEINKALSRGMHESEIKRRLTAVQARFDERVNGFTYRSAMRAIIAEEKLDALLQFPQLGL